MKGKAKAQKQLVVELTDIKKGVAKLKGDTAERELAAANTRRLATKEDRK